MAASIALPISDLALPPQVVHEYRPYARAITTHIQDEDLPNVKQLKTVPYSVGVILRSLAKWEPHVRNNPNLLNKPVQIAKKTPLVIEEIEDTLSDKKIRGPFYFVGKGAASVVLRVKDEALRLTIEDENCRIKSRHVLQPREHDHMGNTGLRYERLKFADTARASGHIAHKLYVDLACEGNFFWDKAADNVGLVDNRPKVLDGGAVMTQARLLEFSARDWIDDYRSIRRARGLPELAPA